MTDELECAFYGPHPSLLHKEKESMEFQFIVILVCVFCKKIKSHEDGFETAVKPINYLTPANGWFVYPILDAYSLGAYQMTVNNPWIDGS